MPEIEYQPFSEFQEVVKSMVAPESLAENLEPYFRDQIGNALSDIQTLIPWTRGFNVTIYTKADVQEFCATSVIQGPVGKITQMFAYKPGLDCRKYYYRRVSTAKIDCWVEAQRCVQCTFDPPPANIYDSPYCNYVIYGEDACTVPYLTGEEDDCRFKSLDDEDRIFAVGPDYKIYAAPRFPCGYYLLVQWQGVRRKWDDGDLVIVDQQVREAVVNRVERKVAMKQRDFGTAEQYSSEYAINLRTIRYRYHDEQDAEMHRDCTAALERLLPAFSPLYIPVSELPWLEQIYTGAAPPAAPANPTEAALFYYAGGGSVLQWDVDTQAWV